VNWVALFRVWVFVLFTLGVAAYFLLSDESFVVAVLGTVLLGALAFVTLLTDIGRDKGDTWR
jgi:hypothetical protein